MTTPTPTAYDFQIGVASGSMVKLDALATPVDFPKSAFMPYKEEQKLVSGLVRGQGYPNTVWIWSVIPREQRDMLRTFCPGKSANVYIRTTTMDSSDAFHTYSAVMVWPTQEEERDAQRRVNFKIQFQTMVYIS